MQPDADSIVKTCTLSIWVCTYAMRDLEYKQVSLTSLFAKY